MQAQVISFNCILKNKAGQWISSTYNREVLTAGDHIPAGSLRGLAKNLSNLVKGEKRVIQVNAEEAYGLYDPKKVILYPRKKLPNTLRKGDSVNVMSKTGILRTYQVLEMLADFASLDGNHPLAGQDLIFEIETLEARDATTEEIDESSNVVADQLLH